MNLCLNINALESEKVLTGHLFTICIFKDQEFITLLELHFLERSRIRSTSELSSEWKARKKYT